VRTPGLATRMALEAAAPRGQDRDKNQSILPAWIEGRLMCARAISLQWRTSVKCVPYTSAWALTLQGCKGYMLALAKIASCSTTLIDEEMGCLGRWEETARGLGVVMGGLEYDSAERLIHDQWFYGIRVGCWLPEDHTMDHVRRYLDEMAFYVACRHGSFAACAHLLPRLAKSTEMFGSPHYMRMWSSSAP